MRGPIPARLAPTRNRPQLRVGAQPRATWPPLRAKRACPASPPRSIMPIPTRNRPQLRVGAQPSAKRRRPRAKNACPARLPRLITPMPMRTCPRRLVGAQPRATWQRFDVKNACPASLPGSISLALFMRAQRNATHRHSARSPAAPTAIGSSAHWARCAT